MPQFGEDIYLGADGVIAGGAPSDGPSPMTVGVGPVARIYTYDIVPATLDADGFAAAQAVGAAGNLTLNGALVQTLSLQGAAAAAVGVADYPRTVSLVSSDAGDTTQIATIYGYDVYGQAMTQTVALNGTNTVASIKAFKYVTRIALNALCAGNIIAGTTGVYGLPVRVTDPAYIINVKWDATLAANAGTFVAAVQTVPSTAALGDVRGTYLPAGNAANGSRRLLVHIALPALAVGPNSTRIGAYGVPQV